MATPRTLLSALTFVSPNIGSGTLSIDSSTLPFTINADTSTLFILVQAYGQLLVFDAPSAVTLNGTTYNQFTGSITIQTGTQQTQIVFMGSNYNPNDPSDPNLNNPEISQAIQLTLVYFNSGLATQIGPPSGVQARNGRTSCTLQWVTPSYSGFIGVRVQTSTDYAGVNPPYTQFGQPIAAVSSTASVPLSSSTTSAVAGSTTTTTTVATTQSFNFSSVTIPSTYFTTSVFYAVVSTIIQDPTTNAIFESQQNGPVKCGFVDLSLASPSDFLALQQKEDIASRLISSVLRNYPNLDLSPRSELRDLFIDPISIELSNMSVRQWFARVSSSPSALATLDDPTNSGVSSQAATDPTKQLIAQAYGLNATDCQALIDKQFDLIAEWAGETRLAPTTATTSVTFYSYAQPTALMSVPVGAVVATLPDAQTPSVQFVTTGSGQITPQTASSYWDAQNEWWGFQVPVQAQQAGASGNAGANTITQVVSGPTGGLAVTNLLPALGGSDQESNASLIARTKLRMTTGVDASSADALTALALATPGVTDALVVQAGDAEMLRDWDPVTQTHIYGSTDVYIRGTTTSQETDSVAFSYENSGVQGDTSTYLACSLLNATTLSFAIKNYSTLPYLGYSVAEFWAVRSSAASGSFQFGVQHAQIDASGTLWLDPSEYAYTTNADGSTTVLQLNGINATNQAALNSVQGAGSIQYRLLMRYQSGVSWTPANQPILAVSSISGPLTGQLPAPVLTRSEDFLLNGGSNLSNDSVLATSLTTQLATKTVSFPSKTSGAQITVDSNISLTLLNGTPQGFVSVRSTDLSTLYSFGTDYTVVAAGPYRTYAIVIAPGSAILSQSGTTPSVVVGYNQYILYERVSSVTAEQQTLSSNTPVTLAQQGFIRNVWQPTSHGVTTLTADSALASVPYANRYIKVLYGTAVVYENLDFTLTVDSTSGQATLTRISTGAIPSGATVTVSYLYNEVFSVATTYPAYVEQLATAIATSRAAGASILVKNMMASQVDISASITLASTANLTTTDAAIRSAIAIAMNQIRDGKLYQSDIVARIMAVPGVLSVKLPLLKCAKSDGAYDIGVVIPTQTAWTALGQDPSFASIGVPANSYITTTWTLPDSTIPGGGTSNQYVGLLYQGTAYRRATSIADFLANSSSAPSFYFIGLDDTLNGAALPTSYEGRVLVTVPASISTPGLLGFFATFVVSGESGAKDIAVSAVEYLAPGSIYLSYA